MTIHRITNFLSVISVFAGSLLIGACGPDSSAPYSEIVEPDPTAFELTDAEAEDIVRLAYPYVALYNVNNKGVMDPDNPTAVGGWNRVRASTVLMDHNLRIIARPNNDTLYISAALDLRHEPMIIESPTFESDYVSMMAIGYDHYVNVPMGTRIGDFGEPSRILFYSARTPDYAGEPIDGVDKIAEMTGDFVGVVFRVMPHLNEPERFERIMEDMNEVRVISLSEHQTGAPADPVPEAEFPPFGATDIDIFENNLLEVMQFVFNHTTFDPNNDIDEAVLETFAELGVIPGQQFDADNVIQIDSAQLRAAAERVTAEEMAKAADAEFTAANFTRLFYPKGEMTQDLLLFQSVFGPIGLPSQEAVYPPVTGESGTTLNAMNDYVIHMAPEEMPPATAFWSLTLYDLQNGFFIPNDRKKYSVGANAGMQLDDNGGITIHVAAERPDGVPEDNWLPLNRGDYEIDLLMRIYAPDLERYSTWTPPIAQVDSPNGE